MATFIDTHKKQGISQRQLRVGEEVRHILTQILQRNMVFDEILMSNSISVTQVRMSPDLKHARAYIMTLDASALQNVIKALNDQATAIKGYLSQKLTIKFMPKLYFSEDESYAAAEKINLLLRSPEVARDLINKPEDDQNSS